MIRNIFLQSKNEEIKIFPGKEPQQKKSFGLAYHDMGTFLYTSRGHPNSQTGTAGGHKSMY